MCVEVDCCGRMHDRRTLQGDPARCPARRGRWVPRHRPQVSGRPSTARKAFRHMKITVVGASGLIGSKVADLLSAEGHEVVAASRSSGVDALTGDGMAEALTGGEVLVDVTNSPSFEDGPVMEFFTTSTTNLLAAAKARRRRPLRRVVHRRGRRTAGQRLHAGQGRPGEAPHRFGSAVLDRARHSVRRVHRRHRGAGSDGRRRNSASPTR